MVRVLATGSRRFRSLEVARTALSEARWTLGPHFTVVHGGAQGADMLIDELAMGYGLEVEAHPANWSAPCRESCRQGHRRQRRDGSSYCPAAGDYRNQLMVDLGADLTLAFLVPLSVSPCKGTRDAARRATAAKIPVRWYVQEAS